MCTFSPFIAVLILIDWPIINFMNLATSRSSKRAKKWACGTVMVLTNKC